MPEDVYRMPPDEALRELRKLRQDRDAIDSAIENLEEQLVPLFPPQKRSLINLGGFYNRLVVEVSSHAGIIVIEEIPIIEGRELKWVADADPEIEPIGEALAAAVDDFDPFESDRDRP